MTSEFDRRRAAWLLEAQRRHDRDVSVLDEAERIVGTMVEVRVRSYPAPTRRAYQPKPAMEQRPSRPGVPLPPPGSGRVTFSTTPWEDFELFRVQLPPRPRVLVALDMGRAVAVPSGAMFFGGDRAWRREVSP